MSSTVPTRKFSPKTIFIASLLLAAIVGGLVSLGVTYLPRPGPASQTRDIYLFAFDQNFNSTATIGLKFDYLYLPSLIAVNKGDTVKIHFYNPTDKAHSFTIGAPYSNDVTVAAMTPGNPGVIRNANVTITTSQVGIFTFNCKFHPPQMTGTIQVQG
jgi:plastocyanin